MSCHGCGEQVGRGKRSTTWNLKLSLSQTTGWTKLSQPTDGEETQSKPKWTKLLGTFYLILFSWMISYPRASRGRLRPYLRDLRAAVDHRWVQPRVGEWTWLGTGRASSGPTQRARATEPLRWTVADGGHGSRSWSACKATKTQV